MFVPNVTVLDIQRYQQTYNQWEISIQKTTFRPSFVGLHQAFLQEQCSELLIYTKKMTSLSTEKKRSYIVIKNRNRVLTMTKNWHNGGLLCMYCSGERVPDFANAKSCVLVKVLVPSDEQGFLDFPGPESVLCQ